MFHKKNDKEVDIRSLNDIIHTSKRLLNIGYFMAIVCLILLGTYLLQEWKILNYIADLLRVISPIFIGFILAWLCAPMVNKLQKKMPRLVSCLVVYLGMLLVVILIGYAFIPSIISQITEFIQTLPSIVDELKEFTDGIFKSMNNSLFESYNVKDQIYLSIENLATGMTTNLPERLFDIGKALISGGLNIVLGIMIGFYILFDFDKINQKIHEMLPNKWKDGYKDLCGRINESLRSYIQGLFLVMFLVFITQSIGLTIAGVKAPLVFALFCAITDVIPYVGPYIGAVPAVIVGFTMSPIVGICCVISIVVVQLLENNFYQPLIMGHTMKLHPVTIMIGLLVFEHFFGIVGMIVATPTIACLKVIFTFINEKANLIRVNEE